MKEKNLTIGSKEKVTLSNGRMWIEFNQTKDGTKEIIAYLDIVEMSDSLMQRAGIENTNGLSLVIRGGNNDDNSTLNFSTEVMVEYGADNDKKDMTIPIELIEFEDDLKKILLDRVKDFMELE